MATAKQKREAALEAMRERKLKSQQKKKEKKQKSLQAKLVSEEQKKVLNKEIALLQSTSEQQAIVKSMLLAQAKQEKYANKKIKQRDEESDSEYSDTEEAVLSLPNISAPISQNRLDDEDHFSTPLVKDKPLPLLEPIMAQKYTNLVADNDDISDQDKFTLRANFDSLKPREELIKSINEKERLSVSKNEIEALNNFRKENPISLNKPERDTITLPIFDKEAQINEAILYSDVVLISAETGAGKTTQVPQFIYENGFAHPDSPFSGNIVVTQPRRIAVETISERVAQEMGIELGQEVGFQTKYQRAMSKNTKLVFKTDGILLLEIISDPLLSRYSCVVLDEAHERGVNTDILISLLSRAVEERRKLYNFGNDISPLKLVIMSATCDTEVFIDEGRLFKIKPVLIEVPGKTYPIADHYQQNTLHLGDDIYELATQTARQTLLEHEHGNLLIFMPGKFEIKKTIKLLQQDRVCSDYDIYPLYSGIDPSIQSKIFEKRDPDVDKRMIVVSTNVAETSLTIPNIRIVIDSGLEKRKIYYPATSVTSIITGYISQASAMQRRGRAGRVAPGDVYHLYSQAAFSKFDEYPIPEIRRSALESVVLQLKAIGIRDINCFSFPTQPSADAIRNALQKLRFIGALDRNDSITSVGKQILKLPVDVKLGRFLVYCKANAKNDQMMLPFAVLMASVLSTSHSINSGVEDGETGPEDRDQRAELISKRASLWQNADEGDVICYSRALLAAKKLDFDRQACKELRIDAKIARDTYMSAEHLAADMDIENFEIVETLDPFSGIDKKLRTYLQMFLLSGYIDRVAYSSGLNVEKNIYQIRNHRSTWILHRLSALHNAGKRLMIFCNANEAEHTTILSMCTPISPEWINMMACKGCELVNIKPDRDPAFSIMSYGDTDYLFSTKLKK